MFTAEDKAAILVEALPYIQQFYGKTIVIKYGGNAMINDDLKEKVMQDIALMKYVGIRPVIVHGGGPDITGFLKKVGKESDFVAGLRVTDEETIEIAEMVLDGKVNSEIVNLLNRRGVRAVGLSGKDAGLIKARKKLATVYEGEDTKSVDIGYVGEVEQVDTGILEDLLKQGYVPVIAPIGVGDNGESYNINADYVAAEIAGALQAEKLLLLTDIEGIYKDFNDKSSFISTLHLPDARQRGDDHEAHARHAVVAERHVIGAVLGRQGASRLDDLHLIMVGRLDGAELRGAVGIGDLGQADVAHGPHGPRAGGGHAALGACVGAVGDERAARGAPGALRARDSVRRAEIAAADRAGGRSVGDACSAIGTDHAVDSSFSVSTTVEAMIAHLTPRERAYPARTGGFRPSRYSATPGAYPRARSPARA